VQAVLGPAQAQVVGAPVLPAGLPVASISTAWGLRTSVQVQGPPAALMLRMLASSTPSKTLDEPARLVGARISNRKPHSRSTVDWG